MGGASAVSADDAWGHQLFEVQLMCLNSFFSDPGAQSVHRPKLKNQSRSGDLWMIPNVSELHHVYPLFQILH